MELVEIRIISHSNNCDKAKEYAGDNAPQNLDLVTRDGYKAYIGTHGYHFTPELAEFAISKMKNVNGSSHSWSVSEVVMALKSMGYNMSSKLSPGDLAYLANMAYADLYPHVLKEEALCLKYAMSADEDPDGYDGMPFYRWLSDMMAKSESVDWERYV